MSGDDLKTLLTAASLITAMLSVTWNVYSWRRAGSRLRVHALLYKEVLVVWIFNAGRATDRIERVVIGGRRGGLGGFEVGGLLGVPIQLAPGEAFRQEIEWAEVLPAAIRDVAKQGWESVWLLLGSMQQRRFELLPLPAARPPAVGWRLAPRGANVSRYLPLFASAPLTVVIWDSTNHSWVGLSALSAIGAVVVWGLMSASVNGDSVRRRIERWYVFLVFLIGVYLWNAGRPDSWTVSWPFGAIVAGAVVLAWPGLIADWLRNLHKRRHGEVASSGTDSGWAGPEI